MRRVNWRISGGGDFPGASHELSGIIVRIQIQEWISNTWLNLELRPYPYCSPYSLHFRCIPVAYHYKIRIHKSFSHWIALAFRSLKMQFISQIIKFGLILLYPIFIQQTTSCKLPVSFPKMFLSLNGIKMMHNQLMVDLIWIYSRRRTPLFCNNLLFIPMNPASWRYNRVMRTQIEYEWRQRLNFGESSPTITFITDFLFVEPETEMFPWKLSSFPQQHKLLTEFEWEV